MPSKGKAQDQELKEEVKTEEVKTEEVETEEVKTEETKTTKAPKSGGKSQWKYIKVQRNH